MTNRMRMRMSSQTLKPKPGLVSRDIPDVTKETKMEIGIHKKMEKMRKKYFQKGYFKHPLTHMIHYRKFRPRMNPNL
jgi:hypothetical protein